MSEVPNRPNIKYVVHANPDSLEETFAPLVEEIRYRSVQMDRVIIYCRTYDSCSMIYVYLRSRLKAEATEPVGAKDLAVLSLVDMFNACTTPAVKEKILQSFCSPGGVLRVVVATVAFGMGLALMFDESYIGVHRQTLNNICKRQGAQEGTDCLQLLYCM